MSEKRQTISSNIVIIHLFRPDIRLYNEDSNPSHTRNIYFSCFSCLNISNVRQLAKFSQTGWQSQQTVKYREGLLGLSIHSYNIEISVAGI